MFSENVKIAFKALWANKLRSILTTLGIIIGVASVIAVVSLVQGMQHSLSSELEGVGATYLRVMPDVPDQRTTLVPKVPDLTYEDGMAVVRESAEISSFTPIFFKNVEATHLDRRHTTFLLGVSESYQDVVNHWVDRGRFFIPMDVESGARVCTVGNELVRKLQLGRDPIGKLIRVERTSFRVVGVMEEKGNAFGQDRDDLILIPFTTVEPLYGHDAVRSLILDFQAASAERIDFAKQQIKETLRRRHNLREGKPDDFRIILQEEIVKVVGKVLTSTSLILAAVVGIALLVGGIGIMNIMLVSVTERTREIGIRKAVGARRQDVLSQFLIEAVTLSGLGGVIGIVSGFLLATVVRQILARWVEFPTVYTPLWAIILAVGFSAFLGVVFGTYPAAKASKLDPIESLRYE